MSTAKPKDARPCAEAMCPGYPEDHPWHRACTQKTGKCAGFHHTYVPAVDPREELIGRIQEEASGEHSMSATLGFRIRSLIAQYEKGAGDGK